MTVEGERLNESELASEIGSNASLNKKSPIRHFRMDEDTVAGICKMEAR